MEIQDMTNEQLNEIELGERKKSEAAQLRLQILSAQDNLQVIAVERARRVKEEETKKSVKKKQ